MFTGRTANYTQFNPFTKHLIVISLFIKQKDSLRIGINKLVKNMKNIAHGVYSNFYSVYPKKTIFSKQKI